MYNQTWDLVFPGSTTPDHLACKVEFSKIIMMSFRVVWGVISICFHPLQNWVSKLNFHQNVEIEEREKKDTVYLLLIRLKSSIFSLGEKAQTAPQEVRMREDIQFIILLFFLVKWNSMCRKISWWLPFYVYCVLSSAGHTTSTMQ